MDLQRLDTILAELGEPVFRARQVWAWTARGAESFEQMTDLPAALRSQLAERLGFSCLQMKTEATARDGTVKALFETADGRPVEAVLMRYSGRQGESGAASPRRSICVSSQSACPLTCRFCPTGPMRVARNPTPSAIPV